MSQIEIIPSDVEAMGKNAILMAKFAIQLTAQPRLDAVLLNSKGIISDNITHGAGPIPILTNAMYISKNASIEYSPPLNP